MEQIPQLGLRSKEYYISLIGKRPGRLNANCMGCGVEITIQSKKCLSCSLKGNKNGFKKGQFSLEKHHNWMGGVSFEPYGIEFNEILKEQIKKRDNYRCQQCFKYQDELIFKCKDGKVRYYKLNVHHIDFNKRNNNSLNLISLYLSCHPKTNFNREMSIIYFKFKIQKIMEA